MTASLSKNVTIKLDGESLEDFVVDLVRNVLPFYLDKFGDRLEATAELMLDLKVYIDGLESSLRGDPEPISRPSASEL